MTNLNVMPTNAASSKRKQRQRYTIHPGVEDIFVGMLDKNYGRKKVDQPQELSDQQQDIISNAVSSVGNTCENINNDLSDYQDNDQTHLISQKDSEMNSVNENTLRNTNAQYTELQVHVSDFDSQVAKADTMIVEKKPFKNVLESFNEVNQSHGQIEAFSHKKTYQMLQIAYKVATYILENCLHEFVDEARTRGINFENKPDVNVFLPIVKTLWGQFGTVNVKGSPEQKWQHNRSCEKYSSVFWHLKDKNVPLDQVASYIEQFGGIRKIVEAVTEANGKIRHNNSNGEFDSKTLENRIITKRSKPIGKFMLESGKCEEHIAYFLGKVGSDGTVSIYEKLEISNGNLRASLKSAADRK